MSKAPSAASLPKDRACAGMVVAGQRDGHGDLALWEASQELLPPPSSFGSKVEAPEKRPGSPHSR